jgi:hypothetical protein
LRFVPLCEHEYGRVPLEYLHSKKRKIYIHSIQILSASGAPLQQPFFVGGTMISVIGISRFISSLRDGLKVHPWSMIKNTINPDPFHNCGCFIGHHTLCRIIHYTILPIFSGDMVNQCEDSDGDRISNIIEMLTGTSPDDPADFVPMAIPSESCIDNTGNVTITYDFSTCFPDYGFATAMVATFPAGSLSKSYIPMLITVRNSPIAPIQPFLQSGFEVLGRYIDFLPQNGLTSGATFSLDVPHASVV